MDKNKYHVATNQVATDTTIETAMYSPYSSPQSNTFSDTSSEFQSDDKINQKFDNFKIAIRQLQKEVQTERVKNQGLTTIISSSKETKEENSKLRKDMQIKESAIAVLQNRLSNLGESTEVRLKDGEHVIPGPSRQILDSLTEENCKLKESLRYMTVDPSHIGQLQKVLKHMMTTNYVTLVDFNFLLYPAVIPYVHMLLQINSKPNMIKSRLNL